MNKIRIGICCLILLMLALSAGCRDDPTGPKNDMYDDPLVEYDLEITYIRTELLCESWIFPYSIFCFGCKSACMEIKDLPLTRIDDYHFEGEILGVTCNSRDTFYYFHVLDRARWDGVCMDSAMVGDRFIVRVKETGCEKELKDIRSYNYSTNPYYGPNAKVACFVLTREGTIESDA